jgi:uncharacterized membrane protein YeaQ/YmgE (transglycosylase-associated protein family)
LLWFILIGMTAGWLAGKVIKGSGYGAIANTLIGAIGGVIGGYVFDLLGITAGGLLGALTTAFVGAVILLALIGAVSKK